MNRVLQLFVLEPALAILIFAFAIGGAALLVFLFDLLGGNFAKVVDPRSHKLVGLEGLRGILAFSVVAHHAYCWYFFTMTGIWTPANSVVFNRLASFGVMQFFYVSGFLFWGKLMKRGRISFGNFYWSRFVRIAPVYYVCIGIVLLIGFAATGFRLQVPFSALSISLVPWLLFSLGGQPSVNNAATARIICGVTWTLGLEWLFYLSLPLLGWFSRQARRLLYIAFIFVALFLISRYLRAGTIDPAVPLSSPAVILAGFAKFMLIGFGGGILIATFAGKIRDWFRFALPWQDWLLLGLYIAYLVTPGIENGGEILLLVGFALVVQGATLFGLLSSRPVRLLGVISYPIYLAHGMIYYLAMRLRGGIHPIAVLPYMAQTAVCMALILLFATLIHLVVERPTMKLSEDIARKATVAQLADVPQVKEPARP